MRQALTRLTLVALVAALCAPATAAQGPPTPTAQVPPAQTPSTAPPEWVNVSPAGEGFTARMPKQPVSVEQRVQSGGLSASGVRYAVAADDVTTFVVWSMKGSHAGGPLGGGERARQFAYGVAPQLDEVAELAWELLVAPEFERLEREGRVRERAPRIRIEMSYARGFELGGLPAREYSVTLEKERGHVYVCSEGERVYVVAALGAYAPDARLKQFIDSFALKSAPKTTPKVGGGDALPGMGGGTGPGRGGNSGSVVPPPDPNAPVDYSRPFKQSEVTQKALITFKPEPGFTEGARKFSVVGVVRLRAILHTSGEMRSISVVKGLPHGLTEKSIAAARQIRFEPARKDGRPVSQYVVLEYNYNLY